MLCQTEIEYAYIQLGFGSRSAIPLLDNKLDLLNTGRIQNIEKRAEYNTAAAKVQYMFTICINDFDAEFIREFSSIKQKWNKLWAKYTKTRPIAARKDIAKLTGFSLTEGTIIDQIQV